MGEASVWQRPLSEHLARAHAARACSRSQISDTHSDTGSHRRRQRHGHCLNTHTHTHTHTTYQFFHRFRLQSAGLWGSLPPLSVQQWPCQRSPPGRVGRVRGLGVVRSGPAPAPGPAGAHASIACVPSGLTQQQWPGAASVDAVKLDVSEWLPWSGAGARDACELRAWSRAWGYGWACRRLRSSALAMQGKRRPKSRGLTHFPQK